jgi:hypothetical protein
MGSQKPELSKANGPFFKRFLVARSESHLYDSQRASRRDPREEAIALARAIIVVAVIGGAIWLLLWKVASHILVIR